MMMMKSSAVAFLAFVAVAFAPSNTRAEDVITCDGDNDIVSIACDADNAATFSTLFALLQDTNLDDFLSTDLDFFVFAPTNCAFAKAGGRIGLTTQQKINTLLYHIALGNEDLVCDAQLSSALELRGIARTSTTLCDSADVPIGQQPVARLPTRVSSIPAFNDDLTDCDSTATASTVPVAAIDACNGRIQPIDNVMGFGPIVYQWGIRQTRCNFGTPGCVGSKGSKGFPLVADPQVIDGLVFTDIRPYAPKAGKGFQNLNQFQTVYNNGNANFNYGPKAGKAYNPKAGKGAGPNAVFWYNNGPNRGGFRNLDASPYEASEYDYEAAAKEYYKYGEEDE